MATVRDIVERAYRKIGVVASDEAMTADQGSSGVDALNMMMHGWILDGIDVGHVDLTISDTFDLEPSFHEGAVYMLASRLAPDYSRPITFDDREFKQKLAIAYLIDNEVAAPIELRRRAFSRARF